MKISLLQRLPNGELAPTCGPLIPSTPCPVITVSHFDIRNLRKDLRTEYTYICDITVSGTVTSSVCDVVPNGGGIIEEVRFCHNDEEQTVARFPLRGNKVSAKELDRPFPFDGTFEFTANAIPVSEGNNTFRILARDKVYGLDGYSLWNAVFALPEDDGSDDQAVERMKDLKMVQGPGFVSGGSGGELALYCFALLDEKASEQFSLVAAGTHEAAFQFKALPGSDRSVLVWPGTASPAFFTVRPTLRMATKAPSDAEMTSRMAKQPAVASLSARERFLYGFAQGLGFEGYDLVFDSNSIVIGGARLSKDLVGVLVSVELVDGTGGRHRAEALAGLPWDFASNSLTNDCATPALYWHFAHLFRMSDPKANQVVLSLLLGDLSGVGLEGVSMADWREGFYMSTAELLEALIQETLSESELSQGYYLGRGLADALRTTVDPSRPGRLDEIGKAEFLTRLKRMPFFNPRGRREIAPQQQSSLCGALKLLFTANG